MTSVVEPTAVRATPAADGAPGEGAPTDRATIAVRNLWKVFGPAERRLTSTRTDLPAPEVVDAAVQVFGGLGVVRGVTVERLYREVRALRIYEGASEVLKLIIGTRALEARPA